MARARTIAFFSAFVLLFGSAPAFADEPPPGWAFTATARFNQDAYHFGDPIAVHVEIVNTGTVGVSMEVDPDTSGDLIFDRTDPAWDGLLGPGAFGVPLAPGESKVLDVSAELWSPAKDRTAITQKLTVLDNYGDKPAQVLTISAPISSYSGEYAGTTYFDADADNTMDAGERPLAGVQVHLMGGLPYTDITKESDAQGHFSFTVPIGEYDVHYLAPDGYIPELPDTGNQITIDRSDSQKNLFAAFSRPISDHLHAKIEFTEPSYKVGDVAHMTVTLSNDGPADLSGITAYCDRYGAEEALHPDWPGHGPLAKDGPGVTVPAGQSRTFDVFDTVPAAALTIGYVSATCDFGIGTGSEGRAGAHDEAKVPGKRGGALGQLLFDRNGDGLWDNKTEGVAGVTVLLRDQFSNDVIGRTRTDELGRFTFTDTPLGRHTIEVVGKWQPVAGQNFHLAFKEHPDDYYWPFRIKPGPNHPDPEAVHQPPASSTGGGAPPTPQGSASPSGLAYTGVDAVTPLFGGLVLLVAGAALVLATGRKRLA